MQDTVRERMNNEQANNITGEYFQKFALIRSKRETGIADDFNSKSWIGKIGCSHISAQYAWENRKENSEGWISVIKGK